MNTTASHRSDIDTLLRRERPLLLKYAVRKGVKAQDAEDVVQDACMRFAESFDPTREAAMRTWLYSVMNSRIYDHKRRNSPYTRCNHLKPKVSHFSDCLPQQLQSIGHDPTDDMVSGLDRDSMWLDLNRRCTARERAFLSMLFTHETDRSKAHAMNLSPSSIGQIREQVQEKMARVLAARSAVYA